VGGEGQRAAPGAQRMADARLVPAPLRGRDEMIEIPLTQGQVALIDDEDAHLAEFNWFAEKREKTYYASRNKPKKGKKNLGVIRMHQAILAAPAGFEADHINGNGLDNRRCNLRVVTKRQNQRNKSVARTSRSGYKGVSWHKRTGRWRADIKLESGQKWLGVYATPEEAARAYDRAARERFGEYARPNFATPTPPVHP
jgi:hypothetical protein